MSSEKTSKRTSAFKMMALLAISSSIFAGFSSLANASDAAVTSAIELNPTFRVHSAPEPNSSTNGTISKSGLVSAEQMKDHGTWVKVVREDGSTGYVRGGTVHKVVLGDNYIVREQASLSGKRVGTVSQISKDAPLVLTGKSKIVAESNKKIRWLEVLHNGKAVWIASNAVKSIDAEKSADVKIAKAKTSKPDSKAASKSEPKATTKPVAKTVMPTEVPLPPIRNAKESKKLGPAPTKLVAVQVPDVLIPPPKAKKSKSVTEDLVCVKTLEDFKKSPAMQKAFGSNYNPFVTWTGDAGVPVGKVKFTPTNDAEGTWELQSMEGPENNPAKHVPLKLCVDHGGKHRFISALGQEIDLSNKDQIEVNYGLITVDFKRTVK